MDLEQYTAFAITTLHTVTDYRRWGASRFAAAGLDFRWYRFCETPQWESPATG